MERERERERERRGRGCADVCVYHMPRGAFRDITRNRARAHLSSSASAASSPRFNTMLAVIALAVSSYQLPISPQPTSVRAISPIMKGRGTRGMPGKGATATGSGGGFTKGSKKRMQQRDFQRSEWTLVAEKGELGEEVGSTLAVEAGQTPQGQNYVWALVRGEETPASGDDEDATDVYATDGSCISCSFPMTKAVITKEDGKESLDCKTCGSQWNLKDGSVHKWLPGVGLGQMATKALNKDKQESSINLLKTRTSQAGRIYLRLPDGTLALTKSAADRAAELSGQPTPQEAVAAAQKKAKSK